jgi:hypothetical protein
MADSKDRSESAIGGVFFVGCMFIGAGLGLFFGEVAVGGAIGMGCGFIAMGVIWAYFKGKEN